MLLRTTQVARSFGDQTIFRKVDLTITAGERLALVGANGAGKTTLLRLLAGLDHPDQGHVFSSGRVVLLTQHSLTDDGTVLDVLRPLELVEASTAFELASAHLSGGSDQALARFADAEEAYRVLGGYSFDARASLILSGLGVPEQARLAQLSGGQLRRVMLARLLLTSADVYLLDEPTNHLDDDGAAWLERWILSSTSAFVFASHDRAFLDAVATRTAELERGTLTLYPGGYTEAMQVKTTLQEAQQREYAAYQRKRGALKAEESSLRSASRSANSFSHRRAGNVPLISAKNKAQDVSNTLAGRAKAIEKRLERLETQAVDQPVRDRRVLRLEVPAAPVGPGEVLTVRDLQVERGGQSVLSGVGLYLRRADRVALNGANGSGKSTLLAALTGVLPSSGEVRWGHGLTTFVMGQHTEELNAFETVADALLDSQPALTTHQLHEVAAHVQLPGPAFRVADLSGGQRTRLGFARLSVTQAQLLILDEPTNHLDIKMTEALEELLLAYTGTMIFASHDRRLSQRVATRTWTVGNGTVEEE
ncbi:ABC-F family ATP-binding cassette domain-containing protein [Deinococcus aquatilis]|uniref:ABC-F family ATP-binding cassette domain-containing protein n=1 Tax=Deinococcus aquatilis TaxID=519440 RepID=UPI0003A47D17|nr:ABC-F family ATP-binding cassette domain-containing protein [Deinococcus aquatilis]